MIQAWQTLSRPRKAIAIALAVSALILAAVAFVYFGPAARFRRDYETLRPGLTQSETDAIFRKSPELECQFRQYRICYYRAPILYGHVPERLPPVQPVMTQSDIPYVYNAAQLMFDRNGELIAFTLNGETGLIHTAQGTIRGDRLDEMDQSYFP